MSSKKKNLNKGRRRKKKTSEDDRGETPVRKITSSPDEMDYTDEANECPNGKSGIGKNEVRIDNSNGSGNTASTSRSGNNNSHSLRKFKKELPQSKKIMDDTVHVNLAMDDLMAYLQVVASNSSNLPMTKRDDPELGRVVSSLTAEEYARKSVAFIPSDVRIICGSFGKYGRVWELPSSEEYVPSDRAQEPGLTSGGGCSNSILKVLYDASNDGADVHTDYNSPINLFEDDDHPEDEFMAGMNTSTHTNPDVIGVMATPATITWSDLLRKMKVEMQEQMYYQVPIVTSSRKLDLNKPFSLMSADFDPKVNKKRSLLIGCNYKNIPDGALKSGHDDIRSFKDFIVNVHGFPQSKGLMTILLDDGEHKEPTHKNITDAFKSLSEVSKPGDVVFVQFSGHGSRTLDKRIGSDAESYDEVIVPSDFIVSGAIRDTLIFKTLLAPMPHGVTVTCIVDTCDTGMVLDLPYWWTTKGDNPNSNLLPKLTLNPNFSFVRFLKVVKTLYDASAFTQLGRAVDSVLDAKSPASSPRANAKSMENDENDNADDESSTGSLNTDDGKGGLLMGILNACQSPNNFTSVGMKKSTSSKSMKKKASSDGSNDSGPRKPSVMDTISNVINCGNSDNIMSDDDGELYRKAGRYSDEEGTDDDTEDVNRKAKGLGKIMI